MIIVPFFILSFFKICKVVFLILISNYSNPINCYLKPTAENQPMQSDDVILEKAVLMASGSIEISLILIIRKIDFIFDHIISIGLKSGLYGGK